MRERHQKRNVTLVPHFLSLLPAGPHLLFRISAYLYTMYVKGRVRDKGTHLDQRREGIPKLALDIRSSLDSKKVYLVCKIDSFRVTSIGLTAVSWYSRKQRSMALSSVEAEYMAASLATCEAIWMRKILVGLFGSHLDPTVIYCDNQSCIKLSANPIFHDRSKHIDIGYHHIRDCVQQRIMLLSYIPTEDRDADILTKALTRSKFEYH
eukprot:PITA_03265